MTAGPTLSAAVVRAWMLTALRALGAARERLDDLNVYPVPDGDTGTNMYLTWEAACGALPGAQATLAETVTAFSRGALLGARGNSGVITSQLLRAGGARLVEVDEPAAKDFAEALAVATDAAYRAVGRPVEGTILTVARAAAEAAGRTADDGGALADVCLAAAAAARVALERTTGQLEQLRLAGVVDAGGAGLVVILDAMESVLTGQRVAGSSAGRSPATGSTDPGALRPGPSDGGGPGAGPAGRAGRSTAAGDRGEDAKAADAGGSGGCPAGRAGGSTVGGEPREGAAAGVAGGQGEGAVPGLEPGGPAYEVMYLLEAPDDRIEGLRERLDGLGDSVAVVGGDTLWNVHVHTDDVGAAVEAGIETGRPHRIRVTRFADAAGLEHPIGSPPERRPERRAGRVVIAVAAGDGLARLFAQAGARVVSGGPGRRCSTGELLRAIEESGAAEVVLLPNDKDSIAVAEAAAAAARHEGVRTAVIPTRAQVQGLAAVAVHDPERSFDDDVVNLSAAAGQTRHGAVTVAIKDAWTMAGACRIGDALGVVDGDFALISEDLIAAATGVVDRLLGGGGELITVISGRDGSPELVEAVVRHVRRSRPEVDVCVYDGRQERYPLLIGVE